MISPTSSRRRRSRGRRSFDYLLVRHTVALEDPGQRELAEFVPHHVFGDVHRNVLLAVVYGYRQSDEIRQNRGTP